MNNELCGDDSHPWPSPFGGYATDKLPDNPGACARMSNR